MDIIKYFTEKDQLETLSSEAAQYHTRIKERENEGRKPRPKDTIALQHAESNISKLRNQLFRRRLIALLSTILTGAVAIGSLSRNDSEINSENSISTSNQISEVDSALQELDQQTLPINNYHPIAPAPGLYNPDNMDSIVTFQQYWKNVLEEAVAIFADSHTTAESLSKMLEDRAFYSLPRGPVITQPQKNKKKSKKIQELSR